MVMKSSRSYAVRNGNGDGQDHRKTGIDRAGDEVRRKNRSVPTGNDGNREVEAHNGMHGEHQRRRQACQKQIGRLVAMPMPRRSSPAHREHAVNDLLRLADSAIAERREVRYQSDEPEQRETVPYVETANTSQISGLRNCGQSPMVLGYGNM